ATAPALFITSIMAAYRGLFQGHQQMAPNANSQIVEQVVRVGSGLVLTYIFVQRSVALGAAGFNFGDVLGALAGLAYLLFLANRAGDSLWELPPDAAPPEARPPRPEGAGRLIRRILAVAAPIAVAGAVVPLMMQVDVFFVFRALAANGIVGDDAQAQYGILTNAFMIAYLPAVFTSAIYTSILPAITRATALGRTAEARRKAGQAYRMTMLVAVPAQAGLLALATGVYAMLFGDLAGGAAMAAMAWSVVPIMLQQTTSGVLQGAGSIALPVRNFVVGALVKAALTAWWTGPWGIRGAAWATAAGFLVAALLNVIYVERLMGRTLRTRSMVFKPTFAALAMAGSIMLARVPLRAWLGEGAAPTLGLVALGGAVYGLVILLVGGIHADELQALPLVGNRLARMLGRRKRVRA
ncbi:MAG TPA: polysaccharide biosynthesis protein, partial [Symbiobacteriaceae bacterium]|nr:polysaccharide biosynthesis protein [Symbiobacteriaceae bacterium]